MKSIFTWIPGIIVKITLTISSFIFIMIVLLLLVLVICGCQSSSMIDLMKNYPAPNTENNRVLGMILAFNHDHIDPLMLIFNEYVSMCEAGWKPSLVIFTTVHWSLQMKRMFRQKSFCYRTNSSIPLLVLH